MIFHVVGLSSINIHTEINSYVKKDFQTQDHKLNMLIDARLPVRILRTDVHLQQDPLGEGLEALATLPQVPVTEVTAQLAGGGWARQDSLVL